MGHRVADARIAARNFNPANTHQPSRTSYGAEGIQTRRARQETRLELRPHDRRAEAAREDRSFSKPCRVRRSLNSEFHLLATTPQIVAGRSHPDSRNAAVTISMECANGCLEVPAGIVHASHSRDAGACEAECQSPQRRSVKPLPAS